MRVFNQTRGTQLAERVAEARTFAERLRGLLGRDGLGQGEGLYISPCTSIHSCFMRFAFDAVFIDAAGKVLHVVERMRPWRFSRWVRGAAGVIELAAGAVAASGTRPGDRLRLEK